MSDLFDFFEEKGKKNNKNNQHRNNNPVKASESKSSGSKPIVAKPIVAKPIVVKNDSTVSYSQALKKMASTLSEKPEVTSASSASSNSSNPISTSNEENKGKAKSSSSSSSSDNNLMKKQLANEFLENIFNVNEEVERRKEQEERAEYDRIRKEKIKEEVDTIRKIIGQSYFTLHGSLTNRKNKASLDEQIEKFKNGKEKKIQLFLNHEEKSSMFFLLLPNRDKLDICRMSSNEEPKEQDIEQENLKCFDEYFSCLADSLIGQMAQIHCNKNKFESKPKRETLTSNYLRKFSLVSSENSFELKNDWIELLKKNHILCEIIVELCNNLIAEEFTSELICEMKVITTFSIKENGDHETFFASAEFTVSDPDRKQTISHTIPEIKKSAFGKYSFNALIKKEIIISDIEKRCNHGFHLKTLVDELLPAASKIWKINEKTFLLKLDESIDYFFAIPYDRLSIGKIYRRLS
jgi:hypothetical protein